MKVERAYLLLADRIRETHTPECMETDPDAFFPEQGGGLNSDIRNAKRICQRCPARRECLNYALEANEQYGIWGGLTAKERQKLRR
jgi:WhiB family transcriptional regulator, redox-sensing transcriptional regulator